VFRHAEDETTLHSAGLSSSVDTQCKKNGFDQDKSSSPSSDVEATEELSLPSPSCDVEAIEEMDPPTSLNDDEASYTFGSKRLKA